MDEMNEMNEVTEDCVLFYDKVAVGSAMVSELADEPLRSLQGRFARTP